MLHQELALIFSHMAEILQFLGDPNDTFRIRAYSNVAISLQETRENILTLVNENRLKEIPGVGQGIAKKIEEYAKTGKIQEYELLKNTIPKGFFEMMQVPFLGPKKIKKLHDELGITSIDQLKEAIAAGKVQKLPKFGEKSAQKIMEGIAIHAGNKGRTLIGTVYPTVSMIVKMLDECPEIKQVVPAGSFRRGEETVGDIDVLATGKNPQKIMDFFVKQPYVERVLSRGETKTSILTLQGIQVDLRVVAPEQFGSALQYFTGSKMHNVHLRTFAKNRGFKLSEYGFFKGATLVASKTEEECYAALGMQYIPPELRTDSGEIEAAFKHQLPKLIELCDIKGDLHAHSTWSDGASSIEAMAKKAQSLGYEYIAITDHSPSLTIARGLSVASLKKKKKEIDGLQEKLKIKILFGTEVDILADGSIDYPDEILENFDVVVASVHSRFNQDNTARILKAMENPYVHIIGHPSGRLIGKRKPYEVEYEKIFKKASETGTVLEINSQPERLDLQGEYIREAKRFKCMFAIDSDSHTINTLWYMELGIKWARRGWVEKKEVINALPLEKLLKLLS